MDHENQDTAPNRRDVLAVGAVAAGAMLLADANGAVRDY